METHRLPVRGVHFWLATFISALASLVAILHAFRQTDFWVILPSATVAMGVVIVWANYWRLQSGLSEISEGVHWKLAERLQMSALSTCIFANCIFIIAVVHIGK
jgi:hypothetical protein